LTVKKETSGLHVGMANKENKSIIETEIKGPMDAYVHSQRKKLTHSSGKYLSTTDSSVGIKFGSTEVKTVPGMEYMCIYAIWL
jgi:hypothetical protein